jgi:hypothetical protein
MPTSTDRKGSELSLYDGRLPIGRVEERGERWAATLADGRELGLFNLQQQAITAVWHEYDKRSIARSA